MAAATTISTIPAASAIEPTPAPIHGARRPVSSWASDGRAGERDDADAGDDHVARVEEMGGELRAEREEEAADRPGREHGQRGEDERPADDGRDARALDRQPEAATLARPAPASSRRRRRRSRRGRAARRRAGRAARSRAGRATDETSTPRPMPPAAAVAVRQADAGGVAARVQVEQGRAGRAQAPRRSRDPAGRGRRTARRPSRRP